jgi:hypothetical protein
MGYGTVALCVGVCDLTKNSRMSEPKKAAGESPMTCHVFVSHFTTPNLFGLM